MAAPTIIQNVNAGGGATPYTYVLTGVTAGSTLVVLVSQIDNNTRTYTISDDKGNTWTTRQANSGTKYVVLAYAVAVASGDTTITIGASAATTTTDAQVYEISASTLDAEGASSELSDVNNHYSATAGNIDTAANVICFAVGIHNANATTAVTTGWTAQTAAARYIFQYRSSATALTDERGYWTTTTARQSGGRIASFTAAGGPTHTITGGIGSFTLTGIAAGLLRGRTLTASTASFTLTGIGASLIASRVVAATSQSFALAGIDAGLLTSRVISAASESFALTGIDSTLTASRVIAGASQAFVLTGIDAHLDYSGSLGPTHTLTATTASFALTGIDAGTIASRVVSATTATFALTGQDAQTLASRIIAASSRSFVLDGKAAQLNYSGQSGSYIIQYYYHLGA